MAWPARNNNKIIDTKMKNSLSKLTLSNVPDSIRSRMMAMRVAVWQGDIDTSKCNGGRTPRFAERGEILAYECMQDGEYARTVFALSLGELLGNTAIFPLLPQDQAVYTWQWELDADIPSLYDFVIDTSMLMSLTPEATGYGDVVGHLDTETCRWLLNYAINGNEDNPPAGLPELRGELNAVTPELRQWHDECYEPIWKTIVGKFNTLDYPYWSEEDEEEDDAAGAEPSDSESMPPIEELMSAEPGFDEPWRNHPDGRYHRADLWESGRCCIARCSGCDREGSECDWCTRP